MTDRTIAARLRGVFRRIAGAVSLSALATAALVGAPNSALAASPYTEVPPREEVLASAAHRYANMSNEDALAELDRRGIRYRKVGAIGTVRAPIRLEGPLHGVHIHSALPEDERAESMFEILDARLALALDDFSVILERHDIVELVHYTMFRPNMPAPGSPEEKAMIAAALEAEKKKAAAEKKEKERTAKSAKNTKARPKKAPKTSLAKGEKPSKGTRRTAGAKRKDVDLFLDKSSDGLPADEELAKGAPPKASTPKREPAQAHPGSRARGSKGKPAPAKKPVGQKAVKHKHGKWAPPGTRHPAGLAIDVGILKKADGTTLNVAQHFRGKIGERTCGAGAPVPDGEDARELRAIVCEARDGQVFTYTLTPNYDADHFDHFHMELKPEVEWFLYH